MTSLISRRVLFTTLALLALPYPAQAQVADGCAKACGRFGDEQQCRRCLGDKALRNSTPPGGMLLDTSRVPGTGFEKWQEQRNQEELMNSRKEFRDTCIETGTC